MPALTGDKLLAQVSQHFPNSIRGLITGDTTVEINALANNWTHFILPKPFTEKDFEKILICVERLGTLPFSNDCRQKLAGIESLPVLPKTVRQLALCMESEYCGSAEFADIVANEPSLAGQIIKTANSVYLGFESRTNSLSTAVSRLGMQVVCGVAITMMNLKSFQRLSDDEHEVVVGRQQQLASLAETLAQRLHWSKEEQKSDYLVCLLSSIGELTLKDMGYTDTPFTTNPLALQSGYRDTDVICAYVLILWGYHLPIAESILTLGQLSSFSEPHQWDISQLVHFCQAYLLAQANGKFNEWVDTLPDSYAALAEFLLLQK